MFEWARRALHRFGRPDWVGEGDSALDVGEVDRRLTEAEREQRTIRREQAEIQARLRLVQRRSDPRGLRRGYD